VDSIKRKLGFASLSPMQLLAVSRMGGSKKAVKGLAALSKERRSDIARKGGLARAKKQRQLRMEKYGKDSV
jgi:general stress protein YciG